jgi:hypothetical protein
LKIYKEVYQTLFNIDSDEIMKIVCAAVLAFHSSLPPSLFISQTVLGREVISQLQVILGPTPGRMS